MGKLQTPSDGLLMGDGREGDLVADDQCSLFWVSLDPMPSFVSEDLQLFLYYSVKDKTQTILVKLCFNTFYDYWLRD